MSEDGTATEEGSPKGGPDQQDGKSSGGSLRSIPEGLGTRSAPRLPMAAASQEQGPGPRSPPASGPVSPLSPIKGLAGRVSSSRSPEARSREAGSALAASEQQKGARQNGPQSHESGLPGGPPTSALDL